MLGDLSELAVTKLGDELLCRGWVLFCSLCVFQSGEQATFCKIANLAHIQMALAAAT